MRKQVLLALFGIFTISLVGQVKVANIFTDNMVLQAHKPIRVWGTANVGEVIKVDLGGQKKKVKSDKSGRWLAEFGPLDYGSSANIKIVGNSNTIELSNILVGEVWFCSGQSNMAMTINGAGGQVYNFKNEENNAQYPNIRSFNVKANYSETIGVDVEGKWEICSPETVSNFSAVAYFFARELHLHTNLPIGIINSSWGGTDIETWMSAEAFESLPALFTDKYLDVKELGVDSIIKLNELNKEAFVSLVTNDLGMSEKWYMPSWNTDSWRTMAIPQEWSTTELKDFDGAVWFKSTLNIANADAGKAAVISFGKIDDNDVTWINGIKIGETEGAGNDRIYDIPQGVLKEGLNTIVVKVMDQRGPGGFTGRPEELYIKTAEEQYSLSGDWQYKETVSSEGFSFIDGEPNICHSLLYNAMVEPLTSFAIKGVIWYQGENNAGAAFDYRSLFPLLIKDWRQQWQYEFPFYWVQLAAFMHKDEEPIATDSWAELRESQELTLSLAKTGQVITTDIGDANDIHPRNKQDVGKRLALIALNKDYGKSDIIYSGPRYKSKKNEGNRIVIEFDSVGSGLKVQNKYGYIEGFTIAGEDGRFVWAKAELLGNDKVIVYSDKVESPIAVRYCWAMNPDVNLFNGNGLPASPFRTDNWKLSTEP